MTRSDSGTFFAVRLFIVMFWVLPGMLAASADAGVPGPDARFDWWRQARFGLFIHWGPVSLVGTEISWSRIGERRDRHEFHTNGIPTAEYDALFRKFNPTNFNAADWVATAKKAGMNYLVFTAKHHDGFCEFDSQLTDYKITRTPFGRDVCAELADACHKQGMRLGLYYSPPDWHHPDYFTTNQPRYNKYFHGQVRELLTNYKPVDILWFDSTSKTNLPGLWDAPQLMEMIHQLAPQILMTKRCGGVGDFDTPEQRVGKYQTTPWETCMTLCTQWSWKPNDRMKSLKVCLQTLVLCAGGDGNLLLNVGPMPDGRIEPRQVERLAEIGAWLSRNGDSIYGTRGGPWKPTKAIASTRNGNIIYLHILQWKGDSVELPAIARKVKSASLLNGDAAEVVETNGQLGVKVALPGRDSMDTVVRIELDGSAMDLPAMELAK